MDDFGWLNWSIIGVYIAFALFMGFYLSKRVKTAEHYYLGNRTTPWWAIGLSVVATYIGALTFLGGPFWAYQDGFSVILIHVNYPIAVFVVVTVFLPFFYNSGTASIYDYLESRFGRPTRSLMAGIFLFGNIAYSGIMLYTTALILEFITGIPTVDSIIVIAVIAVAYTMAGGITAVIWTDVAQTVILLLGAGIVLATLITQLPGGLAATLSDLKAQGLTDPFVTSLDPSVVATIWTGVLAMSIYHVVVYGVNQMMVQRTLTARTIGDAKKSYLMMGYLAFFIFFLFFFIGLLFYAWFGGREFENGNTMMLEFVADVSIPGLMGLIAAAAVAASMSSLDSSLNSMATVTTVDFYQQYFKQDGTPEHYLKASRIFTLAWGVIIVLPALAFLGSEGSVIEILSKIGSFLVGAKLAAYGLGFYSRHTTQRGLMIGIVAGFVCLAWLEYNMDVAWPWYCAIGGVVSIVVAWVASVALDGFQERHHPFTVQGQMEVFRAEGRPEKVDGWYQVPGKVDRASYWLLAFFAFSMGLLWLFQASIA
jgi:SSS family solute:Na+ symporter